MPTPIEPDSAASWLYRNSISIGDVAMITGASMEAAWRTIHGQADDARVLAYLRKKGCPENLINNRNA
ncbi:hypothetical protein DSCW_18550 [Desulfosarcina widdelii]|uniref:Transcriptional regulator n=1 Tax=Desulfosarcina widdelii TaxID=947919 RepID=A0A5K7Z0L0_9BACT|nr:hypothetical protein [Desulfosarcina widdelii]BBO74438.1 hypothetical protein DSCW_18550 [Desulfosarcina widdelii]